MTEDTLPKLIKAPDGTGLAIRALFEEDAPRVIKRDVLSRIEHAQDALCEAEREAQMIIAQAHEQAAAVRAQAQREGAQQGHQQALELLGQARAEYDALMARNEPDMLALAFGIARRIVGRTIEMDETAIARIVAQAMESVRNQRQIVVLVHPDDVPQLEAHRDLWTGQIEGASVYLEADERIERGGCVIETQSGRVDARLDVQLDAMRRAMEAP